MNWTIKQALIIAIYYALLGNSYNSYCFHT